MHLECCRSGKVAEVQKAVLQTQVALLQYQKMFLLAGYGCVCDLLLTYYLSILTSLSWITACLAKSKALSASVSLR